MKRIIALAIAITLAAALSAQDLYPPLTPKNAKSMGMGGSFTSIPTAEFSFFGNPAAFAAPRGSLTLISTDVWAYVKPTTSNIASFVSAFVSAVQLKNPMSAIAGLMPSNGGIGGGTSVGLGYAGRGLGLGAFVTSDEYAQGSSIPGAVLRSDTEVSAVVGLGVPLQFLGTTLSIGGDLRPFYRVRSEAPLADIVTTLKTGGDPLSVLKANAGFGVAVDLGATLQLGSLGLGLSVRDIAPSFPVWTGSFNDLLKSLEGGALPQTTEASGKAVFVPNVTAGLSWKPRFVPGLIDPSLYLELQDPVSVVQNWEDNGSALNLLHVGAELKFLSFITLRGGINRGWLSAGAGIKLLFIEANAAVFTEELGALPGDNPRSGLSLQAAIRF